MSVARLEVEDLRVCLADSAVAVVEGVSLTVGAGQVVGLVGESGSGKTTVALALLGHTRRGLRVAGGRVALDGTEVLSASPSRLRELRGAMVAYVPQDPASALNPALRVGTQLMETLGSHPKAARALGDPSARIQEVLAEAGLSGLAQVLEAYPHQLSGGQQQRVAIAMAFACRPGLIVLDEPTTGLDVTTQRHVLDTVRRLCRAYGVAAVYVSHDLAVVGELADEVVVLYAGAVVESGPTTTVFGHPVHPYTKGLLRAIPSPERSEVLEGMEGQPPRPGRRPPGCSFAPRCPLALAACSEGAVPVVVLDAGAHRVACLRADEPASAPSPSRPLPAPMPVAHAGEAVLSVAGLSASYGATQVLSGVDLAVAPESCVAVVGESGSGKTTLARCVVGLHANWSGEISFAGETLLRGARHRARGPLRAIQYIFQNPYTALNPRKTIGQIVEQPLAHFQADLSEPDREARVVSVLADVSLGADFLARFPDQLSGGERQRVAIARALVVSPDLLVCDEVTSALDVSVQATIVELLRGLQTERHLAMVFITHNLALVRSIAQSVVVLSEGRVVEAGGVQDVLERPRDPYTMRLMEDVPKLSNLGAGARAGAVGGG